MKKKEAEQKIKEIIINNACVDGVEDIFEAEFLKDLQYDSLSIVQLMVDVEETFGILFSDIGPVIEHMTTCQKFIEWILGELENTYGKIY